MLSSEVVAERLALDWGLIVDGSGVAAEGTGGAGQRLLANAVRDLPSGVVARPTGPQDIDALTALWRAIDIAAYGRSSSNAEDLRSELGAPSCGWGRGSACLWRGAELVAALSIRDGLAVNRGWDLEVACRPGDPHAHGIHQALILAALREGRSRWYQVDPDIELDDPVARAWCRATEVGLIRDLERAGFQEVRRYWRMSVNHFSLDEPIGADEPSSARQPSAPPGYRLRPYADSPESWAQLHDVSMRAFADHFDFSPVDAATFRGEIVGEVSDLSQWIIAEHDGEVVGYAMGSNRFAADDYGYVASLGVLPEHRGVGLGTALLRARFADDAARGYLGTMLHVDAENTTGATRLYEAVGMAADQEHVSLHRPLLDLIT
jgi:ribosomal protein S18 acetylase RimI-like enzyme